MAASEISSTQKQIFNTLALAVGVLFLYLLVEVLFTDRFPNPVLVLLLPGITFVMMLVSTFRLLLQYPKGTTATATRKFLLFQGWYYLLMFMVGSFALFVLIGKKEVTQEMAEEKSRWENPALYHYLVFDEVIEKVMVETVGLTCATTLLEDGKTARFLIPATDVFQTGKPLLLEVGVVQEGRVRSYEFDNFIYNPPPDTFYVKLGE